MPHPRERVPAARSRRLALGLGAIAATAICATGAHAGPGRAAARPDDARSPGGHVPPRTTQRAGTSAANSKVKASAFKVVSTSCPDALADGTIVDASQARALGDLAATLTWDAGPPGTCHRTLRLTCGPDIDHDGDPEAIVQVVWWSATDDGRCESLRDEADHTVIAYTFLATRHLAAWRALAPLAVGSDPDESLARQPAYFIRRAHGDLAVRTEWSRVSSDSGCRLGGYEIYGLYAGVLRRLEAGDSSLACIMCDCDHE